MNQNASHRTNGALLPSAIEEKLAQISRRQSAICIVRSIAIGTSVLIVSVIVAMLLDWQFTLFDTGMRVTLTATALLLAISALLVTGMHPLQSSMRQVHAATDADAEVPQLEERWQTVVTMSARGHRSNSPTTTSMLRQVTSEAVALGRIVEPGCVARPKALLRSLKFLAACSLALAGFLGLDWPSTSILLRRFWSPMSDISATRLESAAGDVVVPRGEAVDLVAESSGLPRPVAILQILRPDAVREDLKVAPQADRPTAFVQRVRADESFRYRLRAGDGQTRWHTVTVVDYPTLDEVRFTVVPPAYLQRPNYERAVIPGRVKVMQGSIVQLQVRPRLPLERLELTLAFDGEANGRAAATRQVRSLTAGADGKYRFQMMVTESLNLSLQLWNSHGLTNEDRHECRIQVAIDNAPVARILSPNEEMTVAADDVIDLKFEAHDDQGIATAELVIYDESSTADGQPAKILKVVPIPLGDQQNEKHVMATTQLDLKQLHLEAGTQISYAVRVTDNRMVVVDPPSVSNPENGTAASESVDEAGHNPLTTDSPSDSVTVARKRQSEQTATTNRDQKLPDDDGDTDIKPQPGEETVADRNGAGSTDRDDPADGQSPSEEGTAERRAGDRSVARDVPSDSPRLALAPQQSESGQNAETSRRRLKITERLSARATMEARQREVTGIRERVVAIDELLSEIETALTRIVNRGIPDDERTAQFRLLDTEFGHVEAKISNLRNETRDEQYAFVGLQMVDIGRSHVTPARERVFAAIRETAAADSHARGALQQTIRARELLAALLTRYDRVERDEKLAEELEQAVKMYEVYVEKSQQLMREARQNRNPLERKMAVLEIGQDYLDRFAEVLKLRREMMAEFGRMLADDPRLLARYLDLIKRRRASLRDQLSDLADRQRETATELGHWVRAESEQRDDLWTLFVELRMQASVSLARDSAELAERIEKQLPLVLEAKGGSARHVVELGRQIAEASRLISLDARRQIRQPGSVADQPQKAEQLVLQFGELDAALEQLNFESSQEQEVGTYVTSRLLESRTVADEADRWLQVAEHVEHLRYHGLAEVDQHQLAIASELLRVDMLGIDADLENQFQQVAKTPLPAEIADRIRELHLVMDEITRLQGSATFACTQNRLATAEILEVRINTAFAQAQELFDRIRRDVAAALDEFDVPNPNLADLQDPTLDAFLSQLEREPNIEAQLGLPDRPRNLRVIAEAMTWQQAGGGQLSDSEQAAISRARQAMRLEKPGKKPAAGQESEDPPDEELTEEERQDREQGEELERILAKSLAAIKERARDPALSPEEQRKLEQTAANLQELLDEKNRSSLPKEQWNRLAQSDQMKAILKALARGDGLPDEQWNKLLSTLGDGLWQVGGRTLPEDYRKAIEQYQERIRKLMNTAEQDR